MNRADAIALMARPTYTTKSDAIARIASMAGAYYGRPLPEIRVGASVLQTPGAVQSELDQINDDVLAFGKELNDKITTLPGYPHADPRPPQEQFFASVWSPFVQDWQGWYQKHNGWLGNLMWNHAPEAEEYRKQLIALRDKARGVGIDVQSPEPAAPPKGLVDSVGEAAWGVLKIILIAAISAIGLGFIISLLRK